ncbi:MAG TPA: YdiU family protein [Kofleriaceae bacterium]|nr:YdiU family protein [Kofleriaceae bacterium]
MTPEAPGEAATAGMMFDDRYARELEGAYVAWHASAAPAPKLVKLNRALAAELGLDADALDGDLGARIFSGNQVPPGARPIALVYAGHQFGGFAPRLGDGRALLLGELVDRRGRRRDLQLKGSGPTPFARGGDGKATLGPVLREYVIAEAMAALGIPTTRALAAVTTGEQVWRERPLPGAVLARVADSHLRIGTFEYFASRKDTAMLRKLVDHAIARHLPEAGGAGGAAGESEAGPARARALLAFVVERQAELVARWMLVGFIHGVMNTDNMTISGETIDYGPCAFMDATDPATVYSSIDHGGRYAFGNQPRIAQWNLARLAEALLPVIDDDQPAAIEAATDIVRGFEARYQRHWRAGLRAKLGLERPAAGGESDDDRVLVDDWIGLLVEHAVDYTLGFRALAAAATGDDAPVAIQFPARTEASWKPWLATWRRRLGARAAEAAASMRLVNPAFIARNHRVEDALAAAVELGDLRPFETLLAILARPFDDQPAHAAAMAPPAREVQRRHQTFCGT